MTEEFITEFTQGAKATAERATRAHANGHSETPVAVQDMPEAQ